MLFWEIVNARFLSHYTFPCKHYLTYTGIVEVTGDIKINKAFTVSKNSVTLLDIFLFLEGFNC